MITIEEDLLPGVKRVALKLHRDERGFFAELYRRRLYEEVGVTEPFVQDNHSFSKKGVIRGMHFQAGPGQAKLVSVLSGKIYDVFVDVRPDSPHFGQWGAVRLDPSCQLFIPAGYAHGFAALEEAHVFYKVSTPYNPVTETTFHYDDPAVGIEWPVADPIVSERDQMAPSFSEVLQ